MNSFEKIWQQKYTFLGTFFIVFTISYLFLVAIDFLPEEPQAITEVEEEVVEMAEPEEVPEMVEDEVIEPDPEPEVVEAVAPVAVSAPVYTAPEPVATIDQSALPLKITIERLGKTVQVLNPNSRLVNDLDAALLDGVVRHPDSANMLQDGNVFILGHSSHLPRVFNKNFQAFNGIESLQWGDIIRVYTSNAVYDYRVEKVYEAKATELVVPIAGTGKMLTLATCNNFGSIEDRFIVESKQVNVTPF